MRRRHDIPEAYAAYNLRCAAKSLCSSVHKLSRCICFVPHETTWANLPPSRTSGEARLNHLSRPPQLCARGARKYLYDYRPDVPRWLSHSDPSAIIWHWRRVYFHAHRNEIYGMDCSTGRNPGGLPVQRMVCLRSASEPHRGLRRTLAPPRYYRLRDSPELCTNLPDLLVCTSHPWLHKVPYTKVSRRKWL
ncbi:hypothetical protein OH77DRAFT_291288 [Trametes cingulata]|nr:hypothetical protein OH77DRAFT_291288 [Trametes cingulata]